MSRSQQDDSKLRPPIARLAARQWAYSASIVTLAVLVWSVSTDASGYFWPGWVMVIVLFAFITRVGRAALRETTEIYKLEVRCGGAR